VLLSVLSTLGVLWVLSPRDWLAGRLELILWGGIMSVLTAGFLLDRTLPGQRASTANAGAALRQLDLRGRFLVLGALTIAVYVVFLGLSTHFSNQLLSDDWLERAIHCDLHGSARSLLGFGLLFLIWRRTDPFTPGLSGGFLGAVAGCLGVYGTTLGCGSEEGFHLLFAHALVISLFTGLGFVLGPRWLAP